MSVKDSIIEAFKAENLKLKSRVDSLEEKVIGLDISRNKLDQYTRRNNIEIQGNSSNSVRRPSCTQGARHLQVNKSHCRE